MQKPVLKTRARLVVSVCGLIDVDPLQILLSEKISCLAVKATEPSKEPYLGLFDVLSLLHSLLLFRLTTVTVRRR